MTDYLPCSRYWGSDGLFCATHNGRFATSMVARCDHAGRPTTPAPPPDALRAALTDWQQIAGEMSDALIRLGGHSVGKHEAPQQYDSMSTLACTSETCIAALAAPQPAPDAERLARAIAIVHMTDPAFIQGAATHTPAQAAEHYREWLLDAESYVREYARLAQPEPTAEETL